MVLVRELTLKRRVVPQPMPELHPGGDCGACVLGGLLGMEPADIYKRFGHDPKKRGFEFNDMYSALCEALHDKEGFDRIVTDFPEWPQRDEWLRTYGNPSWAQHQAWFRYLRMSIDAGYYGIANVDHSKRGHPPNHWVLVVGVREVWPDKVPGSIDHQVLVSCSSRSTPDEEWVGVVDFLRYRGGFNLYLARPR